MENGIEITGYIMQISRLGVCNNVLRTYCNFGIFSNFRLLGLFKEIQAIWGL